MTPFGTAVLMIASDGISDSQLPSCLLILDLMPGCELRKPYSTIGAREFSFK